MVTSMLDVLSRGVLQNSIHCYLFAIILFYMHSHCLNPIKLSNMFPFNIIKLFNCLKLYLTALDFPFKCIMNNSTALNFVFMLKCLPLNAKKHNLSRIKIKYYLLYRLKRYLTT